MKKLVDKFPFFLKKSSDSNFYKSEFVFNEQFKEIYNDLFQVYESFHLQKRLMVWRSQSEAYNYSINFIANYPYLKSVTCYKNNEVIYTKSYSYEDNVSTFTYIYDGSSQTIIPTDKFKIMVETYEEYSLVKGFPENNISQGNIYDHDSSLDSFGVLNNIPRKTYRKVHQLNNNTYYIYKGSNIINFDKLTIKDINDSPDFQVFNTQQLIDYYKKTEFPFNNEETEDDYHYMNRIINYISYIHDYPLPVLEIWKIYGLPLEQISLINRERYLCKMFEENRHLNENGTYDETWKPHKWEHKDLMCGKRKEDIFFFANVNNSSPIQSRPVKFNFQFFNEFARKVTNNYYIAVYVKINDGTEREFERFLNCYPDDAKTYIDTSVRGFSWIINTDDFPGIDDGAFSFDFVFRAYEDLDDLTELNNNYIESDIIRITIKGCNNADLYVDCVTGNDNNPGTATQPLRTVTRAIQKLEGYNNVIVLVNKNKRFYIDDVLKINESCSIISCPKDAVIYQNNGFEIFRVFQDNHLYLQNIILKHKCCEMYAKADDFINSNTMNYPLKLTIPDWVCKINTKIVMSSDTYNFYTHHDYTVGGILSTEDGATRLSNATVELYNSNDDLLDTTTTNNNGEYTFTNRFTTPGTYNFTVRYPETKRYCNSETTYQAIVELMPTLLTATTQEKILIDDPFTVTYNVKDYYNLPVTTGTLKLYEGNTLLKTINNGSALSYTPASDGLHTYRLVYTNDGYVTSEVSFKVNVVKYHTEVFLMGEGKSTYLTTENIPITGVLMDERETPLANMPLKLYRDDTLITTLTSNNKGEVSWTGKLPKGKHTLHLEFAATHKYYACSSNGYRVRVRETPIADINLYLYPDHKVLLSKATSIPVHVYATNRQGEPISTSFKIWDTYSNSCEINERDTYTTGNDGWWSGNIPTQAIVQCEGTYLQAISTIDEDVYSNIAHIMYTAEPPLTVTGDIYTREQFYSYSDDVIHVEGYLLDNEDDGYPVPNEPITVKMLNAETDTVIATKTLTTDLLGEFETTFTTNRTVRGHDLLFKVEYNAVAKKYTGFEASCVVEFKQLATTVHSENVAIVEGDYITIDGSVIDENNRPADTGTVTVTLDGETYNLPITENGEFTVTIEDILDVGTYNAPIQFNLNDYYKASSKTITVDVNEVNPTLTLTESYYSYNNETIRLSGSLLTEDNDPVSDKFTVKAYVNNSLIETFNLTSDSEGLFSADYKTKSSHRGKDVIFKLEYYKRNGAYLVCETEATLEFKQLTTTISANAVAVTSGQKVRLTGSVIDENNLPVDTGSVKVTFDGTEYTASLSQGNFQVTVDKLLTPTNYTATVLFVENTYYKTSTKNITVTVSKITPILNVGKDHTLIIEEPYTIPYNLALPTITDRISANIPVTGTLKLQKTNNTTITTINLGEELEVVFQDKERLETKLAYSGNNYVAAITVTGIILKITNPSIRIYDKENGSWDITLVDEFPSNTSSYGEEDYLIRTEYLSDGNPKLTITDDPDYDPSGAGADDIILIDNDDEDSDVVLEDE